MIKDGSVRKRVDLKKYVTDKVGLPTLTDIMKELEKPGLDPREMRNPSNLEMSIPWKICIRRHGAAGYRYQPYKFWCFRGHRS
ncbi:MAG: hypothetical protein R2784_19095 [Saprospiraceae bacterium]